MEVAFLFPGGGSQHVDMGRELYRKEKTFRREVDRCCDLFTPRLDLELRAVLFPAPEEAEAARRALGRPTVFLPALFAVEWALAQLWASWGLRPAALIGHSFGEYVAATLAGVFRLEDAAALLVHRGRLFETLRGGGMLTVALPAEEVVPLLGERLSLAVVNAPDLCVVAGYSDAVEELQGTLAARGVKHRRVPVEGASHCLLVEPIQAPFRELVAELALSPPAIPFVSNVTGTWITAAEATDPAYWARHLRQPVRFAEGIAELARDARRILLEVGPGTALSTLARRQPGVEPERVVASMRHPADPQPDTAVLLEAAGQLWSLGVRPEGSAGPWRRSRRRKKPAAEPPADARLVDAFAGLFRELLGIEQAGPQDSFLALGGHSLLATQLLSRIRQQFGVEITLQQLFAAPTPAGLARALAAAGSTPSAPLLSRVPRSAALPLSFAQRRLWFLDRLEPGSPLYNIAASFLFRGRLDAAALRLSLEEIVRRHETLRTVFAEQDGEPVQVIGPAFPLALPEIDLWGQAEAAQQRAREALTAPFDLQRGPLIRGELARLGEEDWRLDLQLHHVVFDRWSRAVFERELEALYPAFAAGRPSPLPELPLQYADFAVWQNRWLQGEVLAEQLRFWSQALAEVPVLNLPGDRPRPPMQSFRGARRHLVLRSGLAQRIEEAGRPRGATPFMVLLAAFATLLSRHAGNEDLAVGTPIANRNRAEIEGLIGFFVNTLALRVKLDGDPAFDELLARVREMALAAYAHQDLPFEKLIEELAPARDLGRTPLFQAMFVLQPPARPLPLPGLEARPIEVTTDTAKTDLTLYVREAGGELEAEIEFSTDLFDAATIDRVGERWAVLLSAAVEAPATRLSDLPWLAEAERRQLLREWCGRRAPYARDATLPELFARQVARAPEAMALTCGSAALTYRELDRRADRLARRLRALGVGPETPVGLLFERSPDLIVAVLAVLQAGGAYVPLDPAQPAARSASLLADVGAPLLVTTGALAERLPDRPATVLCLDAGEPAGELPPVSPAGLDPDNMAYVMYTSGSTGTPKGVAVTHRNVVRLIDGADYLELGPGEAFLQLAPIGFDASTLEIWAPLLTGGRLVLFPGERASLADLARVIRDEGVTALWLTAGLFHAWMDQAAADGLEGVRQVLAGGDVVAPAAVRRLLASRPGVAFVNGYGPTEGTTFTCCHHLLDATGLESSVPIGRPVPNTSVWVLNRHLQPVPVGVPGELFAGGDGLARGYAGRPDLTAERFAPSPFGDGERLYRTGDLVRWQPDGHLDFLGRLDAQVKISGVRVEPGEVEAVLACHPGVRGAAVTPVQDAAGRTLTACVAVQRPGPSAAELRAWLRERLPEAMVPSRLALVDDLPLTANGKVDRAAVAGLATGTEIEEAYTAPQGPVEEMLAELWAAALGRARVGRHDSFFDLGGHSLLAVRLAGEVRRNLGVELPLRALFEHPTPAELAGRIAQGERGSEPLPPVPAAPGRRPAEVWTAPLSVSQQRLWFLDRLIPGGGFLNVARALVLRGTLRAEALYRALEEVAARHEALRTTFAMASTGPMQRIAPAASVPLPEVDLEALPAALREREAARLAQAEARRPLDPAAGPLLRAGLVRLEASRSLLLLTVHHLVLDGWSMGVLFRELGAFYGGLALPPPAAQYADFTLWQQALVRDPAMERQRAYWRSRLEGLPPLRLRGDRPRPAQPTFRGARWDLVLPAAVIDALRAGRGATLFMALLASFEALMSRYCGQQDFSVGSPVASRGRPELHGTIGFCVNMLVLRADLAGRPGWRRLLERVREDALGAYVHQDLPFETLVEELRAERDLGSNPLFQVALSVEDEPPLPSLPGLTVEPFEIDPGPALFDLTLFAARAGSQIRLTFNYKTALFDEATVRRMAGHLEVLLAGMAAEPERPIAELPLLTPAERQALREWNAPADLTLAAGDLVERCERQAAQTPDAVAVAGPDGTALTYGELNARANQLAHRLRELGVGPGALVGLCLPPSPELMVGMLGIVKAGGAYVPLDPSYPADRWALILAQARVSRLVTLAPLAGRLPQPCAVGLLLLDTEGEALAGYPRSNPSPVASGGDLLYVIFTSGSTGRPKGAGVVHCAFDALVRWYLEEFGVTAGDVFLVLSSVGFDLTQKNLWGPLAAGARLQFGPAYEPARIAAMVERERVTRINCTPSAFYPLVERGGWEQLASLCWVFLGGEPIAMSRLDPWRASADCQARLVNTYGPTECTDVVSFHRLDGERAAPVGRPLPSARLRVLDPGLEPVPAGVPGQLAVAGDCVGVGYLGEAAGTAARFLPDPFAGEPGARLYLTGDLARQLSDGTLEYLGRIDFQVKVRGFRVEPGEVEAALAAHPVVREAAVLARQGPRGSFLAAWFAPRPGCDTGPALVAELREFLRRRLPDYMVPSTFHALDALPLTPHGKVDRDALARAAPLRDAASVPDTPRGEVERAIEHAWRRVLGVGAVGNDDNFFDLGGHSLAMAAVQEELRRTLGADLSLVDMFESPTLRQLAARLGGHRKDSLPPRAEQQRGALAWQEHARRARDWARRQEEIS